MKHDMNTCKKCQNMTPKQKQIFILKWNLFIRGAI